MRTLIWKELRENARYLPIGMLVIAGVCWIVHPSDSSRNTLLASELVSQFAIVAPLLAFALGVVQSYRDLQDAPTAYLNHRGITASDVFLSKVISGFAIYATAIIVPVLVLAAWVAFQGMWRIPMRPAQVIPATVFSLLAFGMHPAAMLMMARSASWWGTRLFPLVPAGVMLIPFFAMLSRGGLEAAMWSCLIAIPMLAWMIGVARQGWSELATQPSAADSNPRLRRRWLLPTYLLIGTAIVFGGAVMGLASLVSSVLEPDVRTPQHYEKIEISQDTHDLWLTTQVTKYDDARGRYRDRVLAGERIEDGEEVDPMAADAIDGDFRDLNLMWSITNGGGYRQSDGFFNGFDNSAGVFSYSYDSRGYILGYQSYPQTRWVHTISSDSVSPAGEFVGRPFTQNALAFGFTVFSGDSQLYGFVPIIDRDGISMVDTDPLGIRRIVDGPIDGAAMLTMARGTAPRLLVLSGSQLTEYRLVDQTDSEDWYTPEETGLMMDEHTDRRKIRLDAKPVRSFIMPESFDITESTIVFAWTEDSLLAVNKKHNWTDVQIQNLFPTSEDRDASESLAFTVTPGRLPEPADVDPASLLVVLGLVPGLAFLTLLSVVAWMIFWQYPMPGDPIADFLADPMPDTVVAISFLVVTAIAFVLLRKMAHRRGLSRSQARWWYFSVPLLGLIAPLAIVTLYRSVSRESCPLCDSPRRVDHLECEHCGQALPPPASDGIKIVGPLSQWSPVSP